MHAETDSAPRHDELGLLTRTFEASCLLGAGSLLGFHLVRFYAMPELVCWWLPLVVAAAWVLADFISGIVHWSADTWGSETLPILGRRFLRPFRVHHANPDDFLRRNFIDTNGDVAMIAIPILLSALLIPLSTEFGRATALFVVAFGACALPTNQVHQWAHMTNPPRFVRWLQQHGLLLSRFEHERHHSAPYAMNYCITNGWCNRLLTAVDFFRRSERIITWLTGLQPRRDDDAFAAQIDSLKATTGERAKETDS